MLTAGAVSGDFSLSAALRQGASAAATILADCGFDVEDRATIPCQEHTVGAFQPCFHIPHRKPTSRSPAQFVDYQLDVTAAAIELATREGFESIEHVKRYTALGFGHRPGQDQQRQRYRYRRSLDRSLYRRNRHDDVQTKLHTGEFRRDGRS